MIRFRKNSLKFFNLLSEARGSLQIIVLFGGMNGGGKTTLMDAIRLALYGHRAPCSTRGNLSYSEFLKQCINRQAQDSTIELSFQQTLNNEAQPTEFRIYRTWTEQISSRDILRVTVNGEIAPDLAQKWDERIEDLLPLGISRLFLFDGEQVGELAELTRQEEALGLLNQSREIGTRDGWAKRLTDCGIEIQGHVLACPTSRTAVITQPKIDRHKAALVRNELSKPVRVALEAGLFPPETTFFDYGCGHGGDVERIGDRGYTSFGWDPYYRPDTPYVAADIVNLGYIINVIEDPAERREALLKAWELTGKVLIVAAQVLIEDRMRGMMAYSDGVITRRNTFQKNYSQEELKSYIDQVLGVDAIPVALGIYLVFRDEAQAQTFRASRFRSRATTPRVKASVKRFEQYKEMLAPLMAFFTDRGRLPIEEELQEFATLQSEFGTLRRAFQVVLQATEVQEWDAISEKRRQDLLVYLALSHFGDRPKLRHLAPIVQHDIKALFGNYQQACTAADLMLLSLGNLEVIAERCKSSAIRGSDPQSGIGKKLSNSLWVHVSALDALDPLLRLYEGCASRTIGRPEEATVVKFHTSKPKISYLFYPDFDRDPHPCLRTSMQIDLQDLHVSYRDYDPEDNPPVLHQKELLVQSDYPLYEKFAKLSRQETDWGLLDDLGKIRDRRGWQKCLEEHCAELKGHRVVWRKDADPYRVRLVKSAQRHRTGCIALRENHQTKRSDPGSHSPL